MERTTINAISEEVALNRNNKLDPSGLLASLIEEVGEVAKAITKEPYQCVYEEAKQVAAIALRLMEECDPSLHIVRACNNADPCCDASQRLQDPTKEYKW